MTTAEAARSLRRCLQGALLPLVSFSPNTIDNGMKIRATTATSMNPAPMRRPTTSPGSSARGCCAGGVHSGGGCGSAC
jgi:hypothetical protein